VGRFGPENAILHARLKHRFFVGMYGIPNDKRKEDSKTMERLDELKQKYQSVLNLIPARGVVLSHVHVQDNKLFIQGAAPSQEIKNEVWNKIKEVDPSYSDLTCDLSVDASLPQPAPEAVHYTVIAGDSLWKIAQEKLGNGALFPKIIEANPGRLKDANSVIHPGDVLNIPQK
jgi:LysM repeat protein